MMEIQKVEITKQNLDYLNSDLEKDLQRLDKAKQFLLRKNSRERRNYSKVSLCCWSAKGFTSEYPLGQREDGRKVYFFVLDSWRVI